MKGIKTLTPILLAALLLAGGCATLNKADKTALLRSELGKWENFSADGVVQASHAGLTLRKLFVINKTRDEIRLDVLGGGAFGIDPDPLVSLYLGDYISVKSPLLPQLETLAQTFVPPDLSLRALSAPDSLVSRYGAQIISEGKLTLDQTELVFSDKMRLERITDRKSGAEILISYTSKGDPDKVSVKVDKDTSLELLVDNASYGKAEVVALPRNDQAQPVDGLLKAVEELLPGQGD